jgi:hypothetical protein
MLIGIMAKPPKPNLRAVVRPHVFNVRSVESMVRRLAEKSENVAWSDHALERMTERGITDVMAVDCLRFGSASGGIEAGANSGEWKIKMTRPVKGRREVGTVV